MQPCSSFGANLPSKILSYIQVQQEVSICIHGTSSSMKASRMDHRTMWVLHKDTLLWHSHSTRAYQWNSSKSSPGWAFGVPQWLQRRFFLKKKPNYSLCEICSLSQFPRCPSLKGPVLQELSNSVWQTEVRMDTRSAGPNRPAHGREEVIMGTKSMNIAREGRNTQRHPELSTPKEIPCQSRRSLIWTVLHLLAASPQLGQPCAQTGMETALHGSHRAICPLHWLSGLGHSRVHCTGNAFSADKGHN